MGEEDVGTVLSDMVKWLWWRIADWKQLSKLPLQPLDEILFGSPDAILCGESIITLIGLSPDFRGWVDWSWTNCYVFNSWLKVKPLCCFPYILYSAAQVFQVASEHVHSGPFQHCETGKCGICTQKWLRKPICVPIGTDCLLGLRPQLICFEDGKTPWLCWALS